MCTNEKNHHIMWEHAYFVSEIINRGQSATEKMPNRNVYSHHNLEQT